MEVLQMPMFNRAYKKMYKNQKKAVNKIIADIASDPSIGAEKKGDLSGVFVYKFKIAKQEYLLAYEYNKKQIILLSIGVHQNFYRDLKK